MYSFSHLSAEPLFQSIALSLSPGELICLTGPNGSGKSTLLSLVEADSSRRGMQVGRLLQMDGSAFLSPGESRRDSIQQLLQASPELLLLDEPTNHLDQAAFDHLGLQLRRCRGALLIVSHDRRLLRVADRILHLEEGHLEEYGGGWDLYREQRTVEATARRSEQEILERRAAQARRDTEQSLQRQAHRRGRAETWNQTQRNPKVIVNQNRDRADRTEARLIKSHGRLAKRAGEAAALAAKNRLPQGLPLDLRPQALQGHGTLLTVERLQLVRNNRKLFTIPISFTLRADSRIGLVGPAGIGKSTLILALLTRRFIASGEIHGQMKRPVLLDQQLSLLQPPEKSVLDFFNEQHPSPDQSSRLAAMGFRRELQLRPLSTLSGGERMRLALAVALTEACDLLILDEPTNDLDHRAREELESILLAYRGAMIVVSHDEEFLRAIGLNETIRPG